MVSSSGVEGADVLVLFDVELVEDSPLSVPLIFGSALVG